MTRVRMDFNGFELELTLQASRHGHWITLPLTKTDRGFASDHVSIRAQLTLERQSDRIRYTLDFQSAFATRLRLRAGLLNERDLFHLIPGNIHGDNNAKHVRAGEFPCLTNDRPAERNCAPLWEFRADRASHPVSILNADPFARCS